MFDILYNYNKVFEKKKSVNFCLVPGHLSSHGKSEAEKASKSAVIFEEEKKWNFVKQL